MFELFKYFNLPFDCVYEAKDIKSKLKFYYNEDELRDILSFYKIAVLKNNDIGLANDINPYYDKIHFYGVNIKSVFNIEKVVKNIYRITKNPTILIIKINDIMFLSCGNINYFRNKIDFNLPIVHISSSININELTYNAQKMIDKINNLDYSILKTNFDYIHTINSIITNNLLNYISPSKFLKYKRFLDNKLNIVTDIDKFKKLITINRVEFYESETIWRAILSLYKNHRIENINSCGDLSIYIRNSKIHREIKSTFTEYDEKSIIREYEKLISD